MTEDDLPLSDSQMPAGRALLDAIEPLYSGNLAPYGLASRLYIKIAYQGSSDSDRKVYSEKIRDYRIDRRYRALQNRMGICSWRDDELKNQ